MELHRSTLALAVALLAGCAGDGSPERAPWGGPPAPPEGKEEVSVAEFNVYADAEGDAWTRSPLLTASQFLGPADAEAGAAALVVAPHGEGAKETTVTATLDRLRDASVQAVRYVLRLRRDDDGSWRLASARRTQRCARGRGHRDFSAELCL